MWCWCVHIYSCAVYARVLSVILTAEPERALIRIYVVNIFVLDRNIVNDRLLLLIHRIFRVYFLYHTFAARQDNVSFINFRSLPKMSTIGRMICLREWLLIQYWLGVINSPNLITNQCFLCAKTFDSIWLQKYTCGVAFDYCVRTWSCITYINVATFIVQWERRLGEKP